MNLKQTFENPILTGFYSDPSICKVKDNYYLVNSSFYYFPGLPIFQSKDLVHWEQIGNAISRPGQIDYKNCDSSEGLWAPTIRHHDGRFYIINTLDVNGRIERYNYIITAGDPAGEWSDAIIIEGAGGIDPSLFFADDGSMWYCGNQVPDKPLYPEHKQIYLCELDTETFQIKGEKHVIFDGAYDHSLYLEGPRIYKVNGWYYLLTAEGGTQTNHAVNFARSENLLGPYVPCERNPIVSNRQLALNNSVGISVVGHGDMVEVAPGEWYMVLLGIRPYEAFSQHAQEKGRRKWIREPDRNKYSHFNLGRETFLVPMTWDYDAWPLVDNDNGMVNLYERKPSLKTYRPRYRSRVDNFESGELDYYWCTRRPASRTLFSLSDNPGNLRLFLWPIKAESKETPSMVLRRQQDHDFWISAAMDFEPQEDNEEAGLVITQNEAYSYLLLKRFCQGEACVTVERIMDGKREILWEENTSSGRLYLGIEGHTGYYSFYCGSNEHQLQKVGDDVDGIVLSTLVADGFVGTMIGMYASGDCQGEAKPLRYADFDWFTYEAVRA